VRALVAQLDRASDFDSEGREFESLRAHQLNQLLKGVLILGFLLRETLGKPARFPPWPFAKMLWIQRAGVPTPACHGDMRGCAGGRTARHG
jgi:hypothetical protein